MEADADNEEYSEGSEALELLKELSPNYKVKEVTPDELNKEVADAIKLLGDNEILWVEPNGSINIESIDKKLPN
jgi:hypothetical protein